MIEPGEVHSWRVDLEAPPETACDLWATLTPDEQSRSSRFRFERDRRRFIVAHGALRDLLGRYVDTPADRIRFVYNAFGKPRLSPRFRARLTFNLSHSGRIALIAVAGGADVGVDVEQVHAQPDCVDIARRFFSTREVEQLSEVPAELRDRAFFGCWTKKEAYVKARGQGFAIPLSSFSVPVTPDPTAAAVDLEDASSDTEPARHWWLRGLRPAPDYVGALAVEGSGWRLVERQWLAEGVPPVIPGSCASEARTLRP